MANQFFSTGGTGDALAARARSTAYPVLNWGSTNNVKLLAGEFGWPGSCQQGTDTNFDPGWDAVAQQVFIDYNAASCFTTAWVSCEWGVDLRGYRTDDGNNKTFNYRSTNTSVLEANYGAVAGRLRGVNLAGADFSDTGPNGGLNAGTIYAQYYWPTAGDWAMLASRGVTLVRLPFRWERMQPTLKQPLDNTQLGYLKSALTSAAAAGIKILIDQHNYGRYDTTPTGANTNGVYDITQNAPATHNGQTVGGTMADCFLDFWTRLSTAVQGYSGVWGYDLTNEPHDLQGGVSGWQTISRNAVEAIRLVDQTHYIAVAGYFYDTASGWVTQNGSTPWLTETIPSGQTGAGSARNTDPLIVFEFHHYWDNDGSGSFNSTYAAELTNAQNQGYTAYSTTGYTAPATNNTSQTGIRTVFKSPFDSQGDFSGTYDSVTTNSNTLVFPSTTYGNPGNSMKITATTTSDTAGASKSLTSSVFRTYQVDFLIPSGSTISSSQNFAISHMWRDNDSTDLVELRVVGSGSGYMFGLTIPSGSYTFVNSGATVLPLNQWNTAKVVVTDTAINLYVNGSASVEASISGSYSGVNMGGFFVGKYYGTSYTGSMYFDNVLAANNATYYAPPNGGYLAPLAGVVTSIKGLLLGLLYA